MLQFFFLLRFFSNYLVSGMGFQLEYQSSDVFHGMINRFDGCGGYFSTTNGTMNSPSYPDNYPANKECIYTIWQPTGNVILLNFHNMDIDGYSGVCEYYDYLEIRDGPSAESQLLDKLCGSDIPSPIQSSQNQLWMKLVKQLDIFHLVTNINIFYNLFQILL